ncbi:MAG: hypothetical protein FH751_09695 [Firmicutes bacterium]|nr:hypothetical protein [Bacillota bacterium]
MLVYKEIIKDLERFVQYFKVKYKYDQRGVLKRLRLKSGLNKQLTEDKWCKLFIEKSAYNYCAKFLIIKLYEDNEKIPCKVNNKGLKKWENLISNLNEQYDKIYEIAQYDIESLEEMKLTFKKTDYDIFKIDNELAKLIINSMKKYDFKGYDIEVIYDIFNNLYTEEKRFGLNLQYFYKPAKAIEYINSIKEQGENLVN